MSGSADRPLLEVRVQKQLERFNLDASFVLRQGKGVLFGPSGVGKSLAFSCLAGFIQPDRGRIVLDGRTLFDSRQGIDLPIRERRVGILTQDHPVFPHLTVEQNLAFGMCQEDRCQLSEVAEMLRIDKHLEQTGASLSGGQRQRVSLARTLLSRPEIILLDEPFSHLDRNVKDRIIRRFQEVESAFDLPYLMVTHSLEEAFEFGEEVALMDDGRVLQQGSRDEVFGRPRCQQAARLVGVRNILPGRLEPRRDGADGMMLSVLGAEVWIPSPSGQENDATSDGSARCWACIRPEHIEIETEGAERGDCLAGTLLRTSNRGQSHRLLVSVHGSDTPHGDYDLEILAPALVADRGEIRPGAVVWLRLPPDRIHIIPRRGIDAVG